MAYQTPDQDSCENGAHTPIDEPPTTRAGNVSGFSLHAGVAARANERHKLERLCRYITRPAVSEERLSLNTPWNDGTIHVIFEWGGEKLINKWKDGPLTYLGLQTAGFPNMFTLAGPQSGSVSSNFPPAIEAMLIWTCDLIKHLEDNQVKTCEPTLAAEREWLEELTAGYHLTLLGSSKS